MNEGGVDRYLVCPWLAYAVICWCLAIFKAVMFDHILNVYDAKNSNIGSVAICRHLTIWLAVGIPKRIICYHCSNWTNRRNDLTGPEDPIYYSDRVIWLCVLLLLMVKGFDYWIGTKIPQIALDYLTMLNTGQYSEHLSWISVQLCCKDNGVSNHDIHQMFV